MNFIIFLLEWLVRVVSCYLKEEDTLSHTTNNIFDEEVGVGFYYNPGLTLCFILFIASFIITGLVSVGTKFVKNRTSSAHIDVPIALDQQHIQPLHTNLQNQIALVKNIQPITSSVVKREEAIVVTIKQKDNLAKIFKRHGLSTKDAAAILALKQAKSLRDLSVGKKIDLTITPENTKLKKLVYVINELDTLTITPRSQNHWSVNIKHIEPTGIFRYAAVTVTSSIHAAARKAEISRKILNQLTDIFGTKEVFKKMHKGDRFAVFYKEYVANGKKVKEGEIAAAEFVHNGQVHRLIGFTDPHGNTNYYTPEGIGIKPPFVRYPLKYNHIGSRFSLGRYHPILHEIRPHNGVDLSARAGTPIQAAGSGKISFAGTHGGHGRAVIIKHGSKYSTLYAHLLRFSSKACPGCYVKQGDIIGYVGSSGVATGPHLHYEFHIDGVPHDPLKVKLPDGEMIAGEYRKSFFAFAKKMLAQLEIHGRDHRMLAATNTQVS